jgi:hypothetical protein
LFNNEKREGDWEKKEKGKRMKDFMIEISTLLLLLFFSLLSLTFWGAQRSH